MDQGDEGGKGGGKRETAEWRDLGLGRERVGRVRGNERNRGLLGGKVIVGRGGGGSPAEPGTCRINTHTHTLEGHIF